MIQIEKQEVEAEVGSAVEGPRPPRPAVTTSRTTASPACEDPLGVPAEVAETAIRSPAIGDWQLPDLRVDSPLRPVDWRWRLARALAAEPRLARWLPPDAWVGRTRRLVERLTGRPAAQSRCSRTAIGAAYALFADRASFNTWLLEAAILAGETDARAAARCRLRPAVVAAYHALFFHVRDRLDRVGFIMSRAVGEKVHVGLTEADVDIMLRLLGYQGGPYVLDTAVAYFRGPWEMP